MSGENLVTLDSPTIGIVEIGINEDAVFTATYYDFQDRAAAPRRHVAGLLRLLANNLDATAAELERLEHHDTDH